MPAGRDSFPKPARFVELPLTAEGTDRIGDSVRLGRSPSRTGIRRPGLSIVRGLLGGNIGKQRTLLRRSTKPRADPDLR
jgi:hypothetical protein